MFSEKCRFFSFLILLLRTKSVFKTSEGVLRDSCVSRTATHVSMDSTAEKAAICQKPKSLTKFVDQNN